MAQAGSNKLSKNFTIVILYNLVARFFMALVRYKGDEVAAKSFLYDVFYHKGNRTFVMLTVFFDVWPEIMFWTGTSSTQLNPLLETVIWAIYNTGPPNSLAELKVK